MLRACIQDLRSSGADIVGAADLGGSEKRGSEAADLGVEVCSGDGPFVALRDALDRFAPDIVVDLSDAPIADGPTRSLLAAYALADGCEYRGADFVYTPPPAPRVATKPSISVIGTAKRAGKTAIASAAARALAAQGRPPVLITMGRGGPGEPETIEPASGSLDVASLLARVEDGHHAASDHVEDALTSGVTTIGTRRAGGGLAGTPASSTFLAGVEIANARSESILIFEGSGTAIPPVHADATVCVVPGTSDPAVALDHLGVLRCLLADLVVITVEPVPPPMGTPLGVAGLPFQPDGGAVDVVDSSDIAAGIRSVVPGVPVLRSVLRPWPLEPVEGRSVFFATTAPDPVAAWQASELASRHGARIVGWTGELARRDPLLDVLESTRADVLVTELKAGAVDVAARVAIDRGMEVVFCDNRPDPSDVFDAAISAVADQATERFSVPCP